MNMNPARAASALTLGLLAMAVAGCGSSVASLCDAMCDCIGCNESEYDECVDSGEDAENASGDAGCSDQFNDYLSCVEDELACRDGVLEIDGCERQLDTLTECGGSAIGDVCARAIAHLEGCGFVVASDPGPCEASAQCGANCILKAPCGAFDGTDPNGANAFFTCIDQCGGAIDDVEDRPTSPADPSPPTPGG